MKCVNCSNGTAFGCKHCVQCLEKAKERSAEHYIKIKMERKCKSCSSQVMDVKGIYCANCRKSKKDTLTKRKQQGLCITCGKVPFTHGQKCNICHESYLINVRLKRVERFNNGLCSFCDEQRVGVKLCLKHYLQFTAKTHLRSTKRYNELHELYLNQKGICPYTGIKLSLGVDSSIDHIIPKSRGGSDDISNLQWVFYQANFMKGDMLHHEFLSLIKTIYNFMQVDS